MLNRTEAPMIYAPTEFEYHLPDCHQFVCSNGIPIYYYADNLQPVLQIEWIFTAGLWYEKQAGIAQATAALLKSGTSTYQSFQINEMFEQYGASLKSVAGPDYLSVTLSCLTKHLSKVLPLVIALFTDTQFPQNEIDIYVQQAKQRLSVQLKKTDFIANRKIDEYLFGFEHPYGRYMTSDLYDQISQSALLYHLKNYLTYQHVKVFMAGSFTDSDLQQLDACMGRDTWNQAAPIITAPYAIQTQVERKHRIKHDEQSVQGSIRLARLFPDRHHPDFYPMIIVNTIFGGYFGSRLMSNIREEKGYTYGIHSYMYNHAQPSGYIITTEAGKDVCEAALQEIYHEMQQLRDVPVETDELNVVKNYLLGSILGDIDGAFQIMQRWKNLILNGFDKSRFNQNIEIYKHISPADIQRLAQTYYQPNDFIELIVH